MGKFILLYNGPVVEFTPEMNQEWGAVWMKWMEKLGKALLDEGAPFGQGAVVTENGKGGTPSPLTGYTIIEADNLDHAKSLALGNPFIVGRDGTSLEVFELMAM